jgi:hypothetical protein
VTYFISSYLEANMDMYNEVKSKILKWELIVDMDGIWINVNKQIQTNWCIYGYVDGPKCQY